MFSRYSTPLALQNAYRQVTQNPYMGSQIGQIPQGLMQNVNQLAQSAPQGYQRYGVSPSFAQGQQNSGNNYLSYYRNYQRPYQAPIPLAIDQTGINYQAQIAAEEAKKAAEEAARQQAAIDALGGAPAPAGYTSIGA